MINLLLDLDNTLISSLAADEEKKSHKQRMEKYTWEDMSGYYKVFERPGLQPFLDFIFANFNVSVWTAASKVYALFIIDKFILAGHPERKLDYIFFSHHCKQSRKKMNTQKKLDMLWSNFGLPYDKKNTYIVDDHPDVYQCQPEKCIKIEPFEFTGRKSHLDSVLQDHIIPKLQSLIDEESASKSPK